MGKNFCPFKIFIIKVNVTYTHNMYKKELILPSTDCPYVNSVTSAE